MAPLTVLLESQQDGLCVSDDQISQELHRLSLLLARRGLNLPPERALRQLLATLRQQLSPEAAPSLLDEVLELLARQRSLGLIDVYRELFEFHREWELELGQFGLHYPELVGELAPVESDLKAYREGVGALVERDYAIAQKLLGQSWHRLQRHRQTLGDMRQSQGYSRHRGVDWLGWTAQRGAPDDQLLREELTRLRIRVEHVLEDEFPDPRLRMEWQQHWLPRFEEMAQASPGLELLQPAESLQEGLSGWLERAALRRNFSGFPAWMELRTGLISWHAGFCDRTELLHSLQGWQGWPWGELPSIRTGLQQRRREQVKHWVAAGDWEYDRWLWLYPGAAKL